MWDIAKLLENMIPPLLYLSIWHVPKALAIVLDCPISAWYFKKVCLFPLSTHMPHTPPFPHPFQTKTVTSMSEPFSSMKLLLDCLEFNQLHHQNWTSLRNFNWTADQSFLSRYLNDLVIPVSFFFCYKSGYFC